MLEKNTESQVHVEEIEEPPPGTSIAFGLERIGLIAVKAPILSCIILVALIDRLRSSASSASRSTIR